MTGDVTVHNAVVQLSHVQQSSDHSVLIRPIPSLQQNRQYNRIQHNTMELRLLIIVINFNNQKSVNYYGLTFVITR